MIKLIVQNKKLIKLFHFPSRKENREIILYLILYSLNRGAFKEWFKTKNQLELKKYTFRKIKSQISYNIKVNI